MYLLTFYYITFKAQATSNLNNYVEIINVNICFVILATVVKCFSLLRRIFTLTVDFGKMVFFALFF